MKRILAAILIAAACLPILVSCEKDNTAESTTAAANSDTTANTEEIPSSTLRSETKDSVPDNLKFTGEEFRVLYPNQGAYPLYYWAEEEPSAETMSEAVYRRQKYVEDRLGIKFVIEMDEDYSNSKWLKTIASGSHDYDLGMTHYSKNIDSFVVNNYITPFENLEYVDFDKPWWNNQAMDAIAINGKHFYGVNDFLIPEPLATFFNKQMITDYELENPYQIVRDGRWTYDKMLEMGKVVAADLNNDGKHTKEDQYGLVTQLNWYFNSLPESFGIKLAEIDPVTNRIMLTDKVGELQAALEIVSNLVNNKDVTFTFPYGAVSGDIYASTMPLSTGRVLFHFDPLSRAMTYREIEIDYGILPWPKGSDTQENYYSFNHTGFIAVPITTTNFAKTGAVLELLAAESYRYVVPTYYKLMLGQKLARDEESEEMLDIIYSSIVTDIGRNFTNGFAIQSGFTKLLEAGSTAFVSYYEKNAAIAQAHLDEISDIVLN
ncbi:hypothetical protein FACS1894105_08050 [Clostridia bacterium]|nr:hypothetical protein FACS1894105_08050 [Clostridia bacterium]